MTPTVTALRAAGALGPLDEHFAVTLGRLGGEERGAVLLAAALASRQVGAGHVCLDLRQLAASPTLSGAAEETLTGIEWPDLERWTLMLRESRLVGQPASQATPLVLDAAGRLYLRRYFEHERRLARALLERAGRGDLEAERADHEAWLAATLARLFPGPGPRPRGRGRAARTDQLELGLAARPDPQRDAARTAATRALCVISGGPGTGKTSTVVKILALLAEDRARRGEPPPRALLLAPTGKAAMRLTESIRREKARLDCAEQVRAAIPEDAATIHRALGSIEGSATRFRHDARYPLVTDVVLVDEASMVDLALMARLVDAVPRDARLILLGDKDQLASVEAGAVLGEICSPRSGGPAPLGGCIVELTRSYRYREGSGIEALARAINAGDARRALEILDTPDYPDVGRVEPARDAALSVPLRDAALAGLRPYLEASSDERRLQALERFRILCAHRGGPHGVAAANAEIETLLAGEGLIDRGAGATYVGRPILVVRNDYQLQLFNGDVGTIVEVDGRRLAFFVAPDGTRRRLSPARLPPHETVFAMTVHKSQGSEFERVAVLLGNRPSPLLTRELLYTAVTRARETVTLHATREVVAQAIARPTERASGLRDALLA